jgi:predicted AlkP superfamily pyrophosphatase or phosphodiesterase
LLVVSATSSIGIAEEATGSVKNAILISWDGVQREHLRELLDAGQLPNLEALIAEGAIVEIDVTHKTDTKAGHAQMLTGYGPEVTGVFSNSVYRPIPKGYTIFERLEDAFGDDGIATIMITGKGGNLGSLGPASGARRAGMSIARRARSRLSGTRFLDRTWLLDRTRLKGEGISREQVLERLEKVFGDDKVGRAIISTMTEFRSRVLQELLPRPQSARIPQLPRLPRLSQLPERAKTRYRGAAQPRLSRGEPYYNAKQDIDLFQGDKPRPADEVGQLALNSLDRYGTQRFFAFFHFGDPDAAGHKHGENSQDYSNAIVEVDRWLGRIVEKLKQLGVYERTRIYVTSDHGFDEGKTSHSMAPYVFLATNDDMVRRRGDQRDIAPTILSRMGVDVSRLKPPLPGRILTDQEKPW